MIKLFTSVCLLMLMNMTHQQSKTILFFGDSITQLGIQEGGYIQLLKKKFDSTQPNQPVSLLGAGVSGNKVYDLYLRLEEDVLTKNPDQVIIWVGVNDVWHKQWGTGTDADAFEKFYVAMVKKMQAQHIDLILVTPAVVGEKKEGGNELDKDLDAYSDIIRKISKTYQCKLVDCRKLFVDYAKIHNPQNLESGILTEDKVHLNARGNQLVAEAIWKELQSD